MAQNQDTRMVVCPKHGLTYDASKRGGCARCIREWERQRARGEGSSAGFPTSVKILGLVLVVAGFYVFLTRPRSEEPLPTEAAPATPQPAAGAGRSVVDEASERALRQLINDIPDVLERGRSETERLLADAEDPERQKQDWDYWTLDWNARIGQLAERLPPPPDSRDNVKLALVFQEVNRAMNELRQVPQATTEEGVPDPEKVGQRFDAVDKALQQARVHLARLLR